MGEHKFTQGDDVVLTLYAMDETGAPVDLTGATFVTKIPGTSEVAEFADSKHDIVEASEGKYTLTLDAADTALVEAGQNKDILTTVTQAAKNKTYRFIGVLEVFGPATVTATAGQTNIFMGAAL